MKNFKTPIEVTATKSFCYGTLQKGTYYTGMLGQKFTVIAETKKFYITDSKVNNKLPKWTCE